VHFKRRRLMDFTSGFTVLNLRRDSFASGSPETAREAAAALN
jgi:hypothetical protein